MAQAVAEGVRDSGRAIPVLKTIDEASRQDLIAADGLILGSPNWSGITGTFKQWLDDQGDLWEELALAGRPGAAFTTGTGRHSGLETTLRQLIHWMMACGMVIVGLPWSERMRTAGSYSPLTNVVTRQVAQGVRRSCVPEHRAWAPKDSPVAPPDALPRATPAADIGVRSIRPRRPRTLDRSAAWNR